MYSDYYQLLSDTGLSARGFFELHGKEYLNGYWRDSDPGLRAVVHHFFSHLNILYTWWPTPGLLELQVKQKLLYKFGCKDHQVGKNIWQLQALMIRQLNWYRLFYRRFQGPASGYMNSHVQSGLKVTGAVCSPIQLQIQYN